ncbi:hypothetical protein A6A07_36100 [Streptomyces sp. CB03911]|nr:hypothetical protein A6A07_36100 [Streptomyces sp. CB03911]
MGGRYGDHARFVAQTAGQGVHQLVEPAVAQDAPVVEQCRAVRMTNCTFREHVNQVGRDLMDTVNR